MTRVLAALAILGLIAGSFVAPARAMTLHSPAMTTSMTKTMNMGKPGDMPDCPHQQAPGSAKDCPLAIMCFAASLPAGAPPALAAPSIASLDVMLPFDDARMAGVGGSPPRRPPRIQGL